jgi:hypothetical protein
MSLVLRRVFYGLIALRISPWWVGGLVVFFLGWVGGEG